MANNELIIDDDYCDSMGKYYQEIGTQMDEIVTTYISIIQNVKSNAIISGEVAQALSVYISYAQKLNGMIKSFSTPTAVDVKQFLFDIDEKDQYIF